MQDRLYRTRNLSLAARLAWPLAAAGSAVLVFVAGRRNPSVILLVVMAIWVSAPFLALGLAEGIGRFSSTLRTTFRILILSFAPCALGTYSWVVFQPPRHQGAFAFVALPGAFWVMSVVAVVFAWLINRRIRPSD